MSNKTLNLTPELYEYMLSVSLREPVILQRLRKETAELEESSMQISPEQGQLMRLLVGLLGANKIIEVGTFTGYSALSMAMVLPEGGSVTCCDTSRKWTDIARKYWDEAGLAERIRLHIAPAAETLEMLLSQGNENTFDMAFIDADKEAYQGYYDMCLRLLRRGGLMMLDNTLWGGAVADAGNQRETTIALRNINQVIYEDLSVEMCLLPIGDGLTFVRKI